MTTPHEPIGRDEARQILRRLRVRAKAMPTTARIPSPRERECHRALGIVMQAIADQAERCSDLEAAAAIDLPRAGETA